MAHPYAGQCVMHVYVFHGFIRGLGKFECVLAERERIVYHLGVCRDVCYPVRVIVSACIATTCSWQSLECEPSEPQCASGVAVYVVLVSIPAAGVIVGVDHYTVISLESSAAVDAQPAFVSAGSRAISSKKLHKASLLRIPAGREVT